MRWGTIERCPTSCTSTSPHCAPPGRRSRRCAPHCVRPHWIPLTWPHSPRSRGSAALVAEHDRLVAAVVRAARELAELDVALGTVVIGLETAESHALRSLTVADR